MKAISFLGLCAIFYISGSEALTSICPTLFQYKTTTLSAAEYQSWSGVVHLPQEYHYDRRVSVDLVLDRTITHLSAHHYDVVTSDWKKFHLSGRNQTNTHSDQNRIFLTVEFNGQHVPKVEEIRLNGARICPVMSRESTSTNRNYDPRSTTPTEDPYRRDIYRTTERINSLYDENNNDRHANSNNNDDNDRRRANPTRTSQSSSSFSHNRQPSTLSSQSTTQSDWNYYGNNNRVTTTRSVINFTTRRQTPTAPTTTRSTTTASQYFPGDLHMLFQSNGNDRVS